MKAYISRIALKIIILTSLVTSYLFLFASPLAIILGWMLWGMLLVIYILDWKQKQARDDTAEPEIKN